MQKSSFLHLLYLIEIVGIQIGVDTPDDNRYVPASISTQLNKKRLNITSTYSTGVTLHFSTDRITP